jgi:hypothetical protein
VEVSGNSPRDTVLFLQGLRKIAVKGGGGGDRVCTSGEEMNAGL